jgi:hypothetical protein
LSSTQDRRVPYLNELAAVWNLQKDGGIANATTPRGESSDVKAYRNSLTSSVTAENVGTDGENVGDDDQQMPTSSSRGTTASKPASAAAQPQVVADYWRTWCRFGTGNRLPQLGLSSTAISAMCSGDRPQTTHLLGRRR